MPTPQVTDVETPIVYSDIDANFESDASGSLRKVENEDSLAQAIDTLLMTPVGSRKFEPEYGTSIPELVFEPMDEGTSILIRNEIRRGLKRFEPRVALRNLSVEADYENLVYKISIYAVVAGWERLIYERDLVNRS